MDGLGSYMADRMASGEHLNKSSGENGDGKGGYVQHRFDRRAGNAVAFLTSFVFHIALLLILACWIFTAGKPSKGLMLSAEVGESVETTFDLVQEFELNPEVSDLVPEEASSPPEVSIDVDIDTSFTPPNQNDTPGIAASLTSVALKSVSTGVIEQSRGRGANFFGAYAEGNRFVYVLDSSTSMRGDRWVYACNKLIDSLNGLKPGQEFFVICFDIQTSFLFNAKPTKENFLSTEGNAVQRVRQWLRSRTLGRSTMPAEALQFALRMNPDAIFLLSDGELKDNSLMLLRQINSAQSERRQIPVHTVHLFSMQGRLTLQTIAAENGGSFTPVTGR